MHMPFAVGICLVAILGMAAPVATPDEYGGAVAAWKPAFTPHGFNLLGMRHARPGAGFKEAHFRWIRGWGFNFVRLPLDYRCWVKGRTSAQRSISSASQKSRYSSGRPRDAAYSSTAAAS